MNINKIKLSGTTYNIQDENACNVVELTQAQYDALPATAKTSNSLFVITDAQGADLSNYYTKSETSGATQISTALASKADTATTYTKTEVDNAITAATSTKQDTLVSGTNIKTINNESILGSGNIEIEGGSITIDPSLDSGSTNPVENRVIYNKIDEVEQVTAAALNELNEELAGKQVTLVAGDNITISGNVISAEGGGKAIEAGRGISITTGETADTVSFDLPISASTSGNGIILSTESTASQAAIASGRGVNAAQGSIVFGFSSSTICNNSIVVGQYNNINKYGTGAFVLGDKNIISKYGRGALGNHLISNAMDEVSCGRCNISSGNSFNFGGSGNTFFTIGNGKSDSARHNAFEIRQNGDIYIADTNDTSTTNYYEKPMIKLQDALGGTVDTALDSGSTNPVENRVIYNKIDEVEQVTAAGLNALNDNFGGLKLMKISQTDYENLQVKDQNTLYIIVG